MNKASTLGIVLALGAVVGGNVLEGGSVDSILQGSAALIVFGAALALYAATQGDTPARILLIAAGVWFVLPLIGLVASHAPLYDNFRQVLFILPPVFMMAGYAFSKINSPVARATLIGLCVLPGIVAGIRLHPYEYVYYNQFIGGEAGAFRRFEMDYWGTSYREAAQYLDRTAQPGGSLVTVSVPRGPCSRCRCTRSTSFWTGGGPLRTGGK